MIGKWKIYIVIFITLLVVETSYFYNLYVQKKHFVSQSTKGLEQVINILYNYQLETVAKWVDDLEEIVDSPRYYIYSQTKEKNTKLDSNITNRLEELVLKISQRRDANKGIRIIDVNGVDEILIKDHEISKSFVSHSNESFYKKALNLIEQTTAVIKEDNNILIYFIKPLFVNNKKIGTLIATYDYKAISNIFERVFINNLVDNIFITNNNGSLLYTNDKSSLNANILQYNVKVPIPLKVEGIQTFENNIVYTKSDPISGGKICAVLYDSTIKNYMNEITGKNFSTFLITGLLVLLFFMYTINLISGFFKHSVKKITNSENFLKTIIYMMSNLLFIVDAETMKVKSINRTVFLTLGYNEEDLVEKSISQIFADDEETLKKVKIFMQNKVTTDIELLLISKSKDNLPVVFSSSIVEEKNIDNDKIGRKLICVAQDISKQKKIQAKLDFLAHHDSLTQLANRMDFNNILEKEISRSVRQNQKFALLFLDLDGFKMVNDRYGHNTGDLLLIEVADRLKKMVRKEDTTFRLGGDEFAIILTNVEDLENISKVSENIIDEINKVFILAGNKVHIGISIGISVFPANGNDSHNLLRKADYAMYQAKKEGKNKYKYYTK